MMTSIDNEQAKAEARAAREQARAEARAAREQARAEARAAREQAKAEARPAREQAKAEARAAHEQAKAEARALREQARAAREQAKAEARAAREQAKAEARAAREQARLQARIVILDPILAPYTLQRVQEQIREHIRTERIQRKFRERTQKVIKTEDLDKETEDVCILCLDKHKLKDSIVTSCNHMFGFECFREFINANENYNKHCPMCRNPDYCLTTFTARNSPTCKNNDTPQPKILYRKSKTFFL